MFMSDVSIIVRKMRAVAQAELGDYNIGRTGKVLTLPLYMGFLLDEP